MKRQTCIFISAAVLALAFLIAAQAYLSAEAESALAYGGEAVYGERADARGVSVERVSALRDHLVWTLSRDAGSGTSSARSRWELRARDPFDPWPGQPSVHVGLGVTTGPLSGNDSPGEPWELELLGDARAAYDGSDGFEMTVDLSDYLDTYDVSVNLRNMDDPDGAMLELDDPFGGRFDVAVPDEMLYSVRVSRSDEGLRIALYPLSATGSSCVFTPEGYIYFTFAVTNDSGAHPDASGLPGGGWGVWRMPCTADADTVAGGGRWWTEGSFRATAEPGALENVCLLPEGWEDVKLELSHDGTRVLVYTVEEGAVRLTVLDAATGGVVQRLEVFSAGFLSETGVEAGPGGYLQTFSGEDYAVCVLGGRAAAALAYEDGEYALRFTADTLPDGEHDGAAGLDYAFDGIRLAAVYSLGDGLQGLYLYDAGGLIYSERLSVPMYDRFGYDTTRIIFTG